MKEIKDIIENPALDKNQILQIQREMLMAKKDRVDRLIANIDKILKGDEAMDFEVFNKTELEDMYHSMVTNMNKEQKAIFIERYGSMEAWKEKFLKDASSEAAQKNFQKVVEWYGSKENALESSKNPGNSELYSAYQKRLTKIMKKLSEKKGQDVNSFEVKELVGEYDFVTKQMFQLSDAATMVLELAAAYRTDPEIQTLQDSIYGKGTTEYIGQALEAFYQKK